MNDGLAAKIQLEGFLDRKMMLIERLARQCPTLGDFHDLVTDRYAAFGGEVAALASETPSVERYERICRALCDALHLSLGFQDTTVLFSPHLQTAFDLMCERPKAPQSGMPVTPESILFSAKEAQRVVTAAVEVYRAFASLMTEIFGETTPLELQVRDNVALADIRALPTEQRPMAVLFVRSGTLWRFSNDILMLLQPLLMRKAHLFDDWERLGRVIRNLPLKAFAARDEMRRLFNVARPAFEEAARRCNAHAIEAQLSDDVMTQPGRLRDAQSLPQPKNDISNRELLKKLSDEISAKHAETQKVVCDKTDAIRAFLPQPVSLDDLKGIDAAKIMELRNAADPYASKDNARSFLKGLVQIIREDTSLTFKDKPIEDDKAAFSYIWSNTAESPHGELIAVFRKVAAHHGWQTYGTVYQKLKNLGKLTLTEKGLKRDAKKRRNNRLVTRDLKEAGKDDPGNLR